MKLFADYISSLFVIYSATIFLEKTSPPLPAGVLIDMTVVTQSSYFHMWTEVQKNLFNVFPRCNLREDNFLLCLLVPIVEAVSDGSPCSSLKAEFCPIVSKYTVCN